MAFNASGAVEEWALRPVQGCAARHLHRAQRNLALVADRGQQAGRLADDAQPGLHGPGRHRVDHAADAAATDLLVMAQRQNQRDF